MGAQLVLGTVLGMLLVSLSLVLVWLAIVPRFGARASSESVHTMRAVALWKMIVLLSEPIMSILNP